MADDDLSIDESPTFDMSFSTFGRINYEFWTANAAKREDDVSLWRKTLLNIYLEADNHIKKKDDKAAHEGMRKRIDNAYRNYLTYQRNYNINVNRSSDPAAIPYNPPREIFDLLFEWEIMLRSALKKLLMREGDRADQAMI